MKSIKKILTTATITTTSVIGITPVLVATQNTQSNNLTSTSKLNTTTTSSSLETEVNNFLEQAQQEGNLKQENYIGDLNLATSKSSPYNIVNLDKLKVNNDDLVKKAYKTLTGQHTSDQVVAKKTYLKEPILQWANTAGEFFDTENEAQQSIIKSGQYTSPVVYYELKDYSNKDENGKPTTKNINPLNDDDILELKKLAFNNMLIDGSGFTLERLTQDKSNKNFQNIKYYGNTTTQLNNISNTIIDGVTNIVKNNIWLNPKLKANTDIKSFQNNYINEGGYEYVGTINVDYATITSATSEKVSMTFDKILKEAEYIVNKDKFAQKFEYVRQSNGTIDYKAYYNAQNKSGQTIFGQRYAFHLKDAKAIEKKYKGRLSNNAFHFLGQGKKVNAYIDLNINQNQFPSLMKDSSFKAQNDQRITKAINETKAYVNKELKSKVSSTVLDEMISQMEAAIRHTMSTQIIKDNQITAVTPQNMTDIKNGLSSIDSVIKNSLNETYQKNSSSTMYDAVRQDIKLETTAAGIDSTSNLNAIYTINYNGHPLFKMDNKLFDEAFKTEEFGSSPIEYIRSYIPKKLKDNYTDFFNKAIKGMTNISNSFVEENTLNSGKFKPQLNSTILEQYANASSQQNNFAVESTTVGEVSVNKISNTRFTKYGINDSELVKKLNLFEHDSQANLQNKWGTFDAVYYYNESVDKIIKSENVTDAQKNQLKNNGVSNANDIVSLFETDGAPKVVKYSEYMNYGYKFNPSLAKNETELILSEERKEKVLENDEMSKPVKYLTVKDYDGNIISKDVASSTSKDQAYENAINKMELQASNDFVFYSEGGQEHLIKKEINRIYELKIKDANNNYVSYGFSKYNDLYNYAYDYVKNGGQLPNLPGIDTPGIGTNQQVARSTTAGVLVGIFSIIILEAILLSVILLNKRKEENKSIREIIKLWAIKK